MRRRIPVLRILVAVAVMGGALGFAAFGGVGGAATSNSDACSEFQNFDATSGGDASKVQQTEAKQTAQLFRDAAKHLSGKTKAALNTVAGFYDKVGKATNTASRLKLVVQYTKSYAKAYAKFTKWYLANCIVIPTIAIPTIPSISIPTIPTIAIPTIPSISIPTVPTTSR